MLINTRSVLVGWGDCDPADIVYYPNYFRWADESTWVLFQRLGLTRQVLKDQYGLAAMPLLEVNRKFMGPAKQYDQLTIATQVSEWRTKVFVVTHLFTNAGAATVEIREIRAWCEPHPQDATRIKAMPIPEKLIDLFSIQSSTG